MLTQQDNVCRIRYLGGKFEWWGTVQFEFCGKPDLSSMFRALIIDVQHLLANLVHIGHANRCHKEAEGPRQSTEWYQSLESWAQGLVRSAAAGGLEVQDSLGLGRGLALKPEEVYKVGW